MIKESIVEKKEREEKEVTATVIPRKTSRETRRAGFGAELVDRGGGLAKVGEDERR